MARTSAQLLLSIFASMSLATSACLIPPDGKGGESLGPYPPQVDLQMLIPSKVRTELHPACDTTLQIRAERIVDLDSELLNYRWVANNGVVNTRWLADADTTRDPGEPHRANQGFQHSADFGFDPGIPFYSGVVSLFITDAPAEAWAEDPNDVDPGEARDLGRIDDPNDQFSVIEVRWTFVYDADLGSDVCSPRD